MRKRRTRFITWEQPSCTNVSSRAEVLRTFLYHCFITGRGSGEHPAPRTLETRRWERIQPIQLLSQRRWAIFSPPVPSTWPQEASNPPGNWKINVFRLVFVVNGCFFPECFTTKLFGFVEWRRKGPGPGPRPNGSKKLICFHRLFPYHRRPSLSICQISRNSSQFFTCLLHR